MQTQRFNPSITIAILISLLLLASSSALPTAAQTPPDALAAPHTVPDPSTGSGQAPARVSAALRSAAVMFIQNAGQFADGARFQVRGGNGTIWLADNALWVTIVERSHVERSHVERSHVQHSNVERANVQRKGVNLKLTFAGANPHPRLEPFNRLETHVSYFIGNDPAKWRADVPVWGGMRYKDLYPGIDLELTGENGRIVPRVVVREGANLNAVRLRVDGADKVALDSDRLRLTTAVGEYTMPLLQMTGATNAKLPRPTIAGNQVASPFTKSPILNLQSAIQNLQSNDLLYATFLGGGSSDWGSGIAVDGSGAAYVTGYTYSSDFPTTPGAFDTSYNGGDDAFVVKLNGAGSSLAYATFLGGSSFDEGYGIAVDGSGAAYVTGSTNSSDFPTTSGAFDTSYNGGYNDAFVVKLNGAGSSLAYATFLGGSSSEWGYGIAVDGSGAAYVTGYTYSSDFPTTPGAFDTSYNGGDDAFVVKLNGAGSSLAYATFLGGSSFDEGYGIAVDGSGAAYVTGSTNSSDFPTTPGAFDTSHNGGNDAFVVKLNGAGSSLAYATFLGGSSSEWGYGIAVDGSGAAYVTGYTYSSDFPTTPGAFDTSYNGGDDAFVVKLNGAGSSLAYATFLGGSSFDEGYGIAVDGSGAAYVTGSTNSSDFPTTPGAFDTSHNGGNDAFVVKLNGAGSDLAYATFLGGNSDDGGLGIAVDGSGAAYVTGYTSSSDFPTTPGAFDTSYNGGYLDAFVVKLNGAGSSLAYATFLGGSSSEWGYSIAVDGNGAAYVTGTTLSSDFPTTSDAFDTSYNGGDLDAFVVKLNGAGSSLAYATFLGGSSDDYGWGIAVDGSGAAYVTGRTESSDFPTTSDAFDTSYNSNRDAFVVKIGMEGSRDFFLFLPMILR